MDRESHLKKRAELLLAFLTQDRLVKLRKDFHDEIDDDYLLLMQRCWKQIKREDGTLNAWEHVDYGEIEDFYYCDLRLFLHKERIYLTVYFDASNLKFESLSFGSKSIPKFREMELRDGYSESPGEN